MATTTNYSWTTPDDTALVKDGAAAIRSLGTAIDTTTYNNSLLPIVKTIVDAKGDIIAATAADTVSRLAVGANDTVLTADSAQATGLKWATPAAGGMTLLSTTTLSGASVTISSIAGTYRNLQLIIVNFKPSSDGAGCNYRYNGDSSAKYADTGTSATDSNPNQTSNNFVPAADSGVSQGFSVLDVYDYANAVTWKTSYGMSFTNNPTNTSNFNTYSHAGIYASTSAINSITLLVSSGNFTSGTAYLYGVK